MVHDGKNDGKMMAMVVLVICQPCQRPSVLKGGVSKRCRGAGDPRDATSWARSRRVRRRYDPAAAASRSLGEKDLWNHGEVIAKSG